VLDKHHAAYVVKLTLRPGFVTGVTALREFVGFRTVSGGAPCPPHPPRSRMKSARSGTCGRSRCWRGYRPSSIASWSGEVEVRELQRRQIVYLPGDPGEHVFFIQGGRIKCSKVSRDGKELTLTYVTAGEFFGELCVLDGSPREEMAEAMKNSIITVLPRERIRNAADDRPRIAFRFIKVVGERRRADGDEDRAPGVPRRPRQARRAAARARQGVRQGDRGRAADRSEDHASGDGEPDRLDARDDLADPRGVQAQGARAAVRAHGRAHRPRRASRR
jgi:CRP-like cAMP-binding protein